MENVRLFVVFRFDLIRSILVDDTDFDAFAAKR